MPIVPVGKQVERHSRGGLTTHAIVLEQVLEQGACKGAHMNTCSGGPLQVSSYGVVQLHPDTAQKVFRD